MSEILVKEIMHENVITCQENDTLGEIAAILSDAEVSALIVVDDKGIARGVISQMDMIKRYGQDLTIQKAQDVMTKEIITINCNDPAKYTTKKLLPNKIRVL